LSTFAASLLALTSASPSRPVVSQARAISAGVSRDVRPLPPATQRPRLRSCPRTASFSAPQVVVVTPDECQSKPSTQPSAWNQCGSDSRRSSSSGECSSTVCATIARASRTMR
jgi:hypothetical protein